MLGVFPKTLTGCLLILILECNGLYLIWFLGENNYVNDVSVRDQFLKPINTTFDRVKNTPEN